MSSLYHLIKTIVKSEVLRYNYLEVTFERWSMSMSSTKESIKKMLEEKRQGTKNQGSKKRADKSMVANSQTSRSKRSSSSSVNKSV